jgi:hypothetical protein
MHTALVFVVTARDDGDGNSASIPDYVADRCLPIVSDDEFNLSFRKQ